MELQCITLHCIAMDVSYSRELEIFNILNKLCWTTRRGDLYHGESYIMRILIMLLKQTTYKTSYLSDKHFFETRTLLLSPVKEILIDIIWMERRVKGTLKFMSFNRNTQYLSLNEQIMQLLIQKIVLWLITSFILMKKLMNNIIRLNFSHLFLPSFLFLMKFIQATRLLLLPVATYEIHFWEAFKNFNLKNLQEFQLIFPRTIIYAIYI
ncbi:Reverse transcriptase domain-containing protein [Aphis craccivora]|uniref:Reverse transcriptase domain-containing protein n=1 Tax=Aphis craccivora TaxID=307492 RepID=A0A6G0Y4Z0_APHCR|nr:Reverse transcriptase domain-containing protein [Aphis craccivora]